MTRKLNSKNSTLRFLRLGAVLVLLSLLVIACNDSDVTVGSGQITRPTAVDATSVVVPTATPFPLPTDTATLINTPLPSPTPLTTLTLLPTATSVPATPVPPTPQPTTSTVLSSTVATNITETVTSTTAATLVTSTVALLPTVTPSPSLSKGAIVFSNGGDIWTMQPDSVARNRLTTDGSNFDRVAFPDGFNRNPVWSPDGKQIVFASARDVYSQSRYDSGYELYTMNADGGGLQRISQSADAINTQRLPVAWLSTGQLLIRIVTAHKQRLALFVIANHQEYPLPVQDAQFLAYSPDKNTLAYSTVRPGKSPAKTISDLLVVSAGGGTGKNLTNNAEDINNSVTAFAWSPDGSKLAYIESSGDVCGYSHLSIIGADGKGKKTLWEGDGLLSTVSWSPDNTRLLYGEAICTGETALKLISANGGAIQTLTEGQNPQWNDN